MLLFANQYENIIGLALFVFLGIAIVTGIVAVVVGGTVTTVIKKITNFSWMTSCLLVLLMPFLYDVLWRQPRADIVSELTAIELRNEPSHFFAVGEKTHLTLKVKMGDGRISEYRSPQWRSSNKCLNVGSDGVLEAMAPGPGTITAQAEGMEITREIFVSPAVLMSLDLDPPMASRTLGDTKQSLVVLNWSDGKRTKLSFSDLSCQSSNPDVADFIKGQLVSKKVGKTILTVSHVAQSHRWEFEVTPPAKKPHSR